jgi:hypothetical protein
MLKVFMRCNLELVTLQTLFYPMERVDRTLMASFDSSRLVSFWNRRSEPHSLELVCFGVHPGQGRRGQKSHSFVFLQHSANYVNEENTIPYSTLFQPAF